MRETEDKVDAAKHDIFALSLVTALFFSTNVYLCRAFEIDASLGVAVASALSLLWLKRDALTAARERPSAASGGDRSRSLANAARG
mmetsp:Transcript_62839/g.147883  ORF Transcript_62839/g.147883 Transcript_62839/m.147883 type:complete len:86 (-) Transcript_62839:61-318(-)